ncbi:cell wall-binding repeat-containing protein [Herbiconiux sp. P15]|uniref:cell wall-binding repeat-containing protein n=1 Tax=Herbiconiux liukaitaii TaxID=3342799 RepID=UPI0035B6C55C
MAKSSGNPARPGLLFRTRSVLAVMAALVVLGVSLTGLTPAQAAPGTATVSGILRSYEFAERPAVGQHYVTVFQPQASSERHSAEVGADGRFTIKGIPAGSWAIQIGASTQSWYLSSGGHVSDDISMLTLDAGATLQVDVRVPLEVDPIQPVIERVSGEDRYSTSVAMSQQAYGSGVPVVYLVSGENFADALSAAPAAAFDGGPLLLSSSTSLPAVVAAELRRLSPARVVIVGGLAAVGSAVESQVRSMVPDVQRLAGADRFATSLAVAGRSPEATCWSAFFATGSNFPDALSISAFAGQWGGPLILVDGGASSLSVETKQYLSSHGCKTAYIAGGTAVVSAGIEADLRTVASSVTRFAGQNRYDTNKQINDQSGVRPHAYFASGENFPDALSAAALVGAGNASLYLTLRSCIPEPLRTLVNTRNPALITLVGGPTVMNDSIAHSKHSAGC